MDPLTRKIYRVVGYVSGLTIVAVTLYGLATALQTGSGGVVGEALVSTEWPFPPYFAKPITYFTFACVAFFYVELRLWEDRIANWPSWVHSALLLIGFVVAFGSAYEVLYNFMLWGAIYGADYLRNHLVNVNAPYAPYSIPWNLDFATKVFATLFVISGYCVYFLRRLVGSKVTQAG